MSEFNLKDLEFVFNKTFKKKPKFSINLKINDFSDWDSLGNFNLLLNVEEFYNFRFTTEEISKLSSIKEVIKILKDNNDRI